MRVLPVALALTVSLTLPAHAQSRVLSISEKHIITKSYGDRLKDPMSAQYRWPELPINSKGANGEQAYCFYVNAKNSYGGYTGFKLIIGKVRQSAGKIVGFSYAAGNLDDSPELAETTATMCRVLGISL